MVLRLIQCPFSFLKLQRTCTRSCVKSLRDLVQNRNGDCNRIRKLKVSTVPTIARFRKPADSQALNQTSFDSWCPDKKIQAGRQPRHLKRRRMVFPSGVMRILTFELRLTVAYYGLFECK